MLGFSLQGLAAGTFYVIELTFANIVLHEIIQNNKDNNSDAISGINNIVESLGMLVGPIIGGILNDLIGF